MDNPKYKYENNHLQNVSVNNENTQLNYDNIANNIHAVIRKYTFNTVIMFTSII